jgi:NAD(P)-dependent dehydrogenase (short-subunit alcohol dehydrogenase family)
MTAIAEQKAGQIAGQVAFITGGASGIGLGIARAFGAAGARIAIADIEQAALDRATRDLAQSGIEALGVRLDVTDRAAFAAARDEVLRAFGAVHLLFNNAGVNVAGPIDQVSFADWDWVLSVNLGGVINGVMTFLPELKRHPGRAHVVNTASVGGLVGMRNLSIYNTSKFGVVGLSEAMRADLAASGVGVSVLCPGIVATALGTSERNRPGRAAVANAPPTEAAPAGAPAAAGMSPDALGNRVLDAVQAGEFFISSHTEFRPIVGQRNAAVQASFHGAEDPAAVTAMQALVLPF